MGTGDIVSAVIIQDNATGWQSRCDYVVGKENRAPGATIVGERSKYCEVDLEMIICDNHKCSGFDQEVGFLGLP